MSHKNGGHGVTVSMDEQEYDFVLSEERLPIFSARKALLKEIRINDTCIIIGETASGKSTQLPQFLYRSGFMRFGIIACTQPRRVAAISLAERVAYEMKVELGDRVGYTVRFEDMTSGNTRIKYMTDGMLLREAIQDPLLKRYAIIILDEAHERTIHTDVLFGIVKTAQRTRGKSRDQTLKVIVMSATLAAEPFSKFFDDARILYIEGRQHPIKTLYSVDMQTDYLNAALVSAVQLHKEKPLGYVDLYIPVNNSKSNCLLLCYFRGDILIFLTGQEEIELLANLLKDCLNGKSSI